MKQLLNLKILKLFLQTNILGKYSENMMNLAEGIKQLPNKMQHLEINLSGNNLGKIKNA